MSSQIDSFVDKLGDIVTDDSYLAVVMEDLLEPVIPGGSVRPATYAGNRNQKGKNFAGSDEVFIPTAAESGWHSEFVRDEAGVPRLGKAVIIDSIQSQANRAEEMMWAHRKEVGGLPGVLLVTDLLNPDVEKAITEGIMKTVGKEPKLTPEQETFIRLAVNDELTSQIVSTWTASHRHADAYFRFSEIDNLIQDVDTSRDASVAYSNFINSIIFGFWNSYAATRRTKQPRIYTSEITGFGGREVVSGAVKVDPVPIGIFEVPDDLNSPKRGITLVKKGEAKIGDKDKKAPSAIGLGMIPAAVQPVGFWFEVILRQGSISLNLIRRIKFAEDTELRQRNAAGTVIVALALWGHQLASRDFALRSGCELIVVNSLIGLRRHGTRELEQLSVDSIDLAAVVIEAIRRAELVGLHFDPEITTNLDTSFVKAIASGVLTQWRQGDTDEG